MSLFEEISRIFNKGVLDKDTHVSGQYCPICRDYMLFTEFGYTFCTNSRCEYKIYRKELDPYYIESFEQI